MATIAQILAAHWPGQQWTIDEDNYSTLTWDGGNTRPKPSEAEIRGFSDQVDATVADQAQRSRQQRAMVDAPDYLLKVVETLIDGMVEIRRVINDMRSTIVAQAHTGSFTAWDNNVVSRLAALKQRVQDLRNIS